MMVGPRSRRSGPRQCFAVIRQCLSTNAFSRSVIVWQLQRPLRAHYVHHAELPGRQNLTRPNLLQPRQTSGTREQRLAVAQEATPGVSVKASCDERGKGEAPSTPVERAEALLAVPLDDYVPSAPVRGHVRTSAGTSVDSADSQVELASLRECATEQPETVLGHPGPYPEEAAPACLGSERGDAWADSAVMQASEGASAERRIAAGSERGEATAEEGLQCGSGSENKELATASQVDRPFAQAVEADAAAFEEDVQELLEQYRSKKDVGPFLQSLRMWATCLQSATPGAFLQHLHHTLRSLRGSTVNGVAAVDVLQHLWLYHPWPLCVLVEAWSRTSAIPAVFYLDAVLCCSGALVHKEVGVDAMGFRSRPRYWVVATGAPGTGKSPALDPVREAVEEVLRELDEGPGLRRQNFHVQQGTTHAAAFDRLRTSNGYLLIASAEAGPLLCPSFPASGRWDRTNFIDYSRFLDTAYGGSMRWETMESRRSTKAPRSVRHEAG